MSRPVRTSIAVIIIVLIGLFILSRTRQVIPDRSRLSFTTNDVADAVTEKLSEYGGDRRSEHFKDNIRVSLQQGHTRSKKKYQHDATDLLARLKRDKPEPQSN
jgi:hypothetical protein